MRTYNPLRYSSKDADTDRPKSGPIPKGRLLSYKTIAILVLVLVLLYVAVKRLMSNDLAKIPGKMDLINLKKAVQVSPHKQEAIKVKERYYNSIASTQIERKPDNNLMLIGIAAVPNDFQRRIIMRTHQMHRFSKYDIQYRFVMGKPAPALMEAIQFENKTYGDIIILGQYNDTWKSGYNQGRKTLEWYKYVEKNMDAYKYVGKLDSNSFLNVPVLFNEYLNENTEDLDFGIIGLFNKRFAPFSFADGAFQVLTWKTMLMLNRFYENVPLSTEFRDDVQIGWYFYDAELNITQIEFNPKQAYNFRTPAVWDIGTPMLNDIVSDAVSIGELKNQDEYLIVADCFYPEGTNVTRINYFRDLNWIKVKIT